MLKLTSSVCPFCEATAISRVCRPSWQTSRTAATLQKRKPSRMVLSNKVGSHRPSVARQVAKKRFNNPWGGTNVTTPPRELRNTRGVSAAEQTRISHKHGKATEKENAPKKTRDPMKALKMQRRLVNVSYEHRDRVKKSLLEFDSFDKFDLLPVVKESIRHNEVLLGNDSATPTPVQKLAIPALRGKSFRRKRHPTGPDAIGPDAPSVDKKMDQFLLAAETGSGKTLAYVLPIVDAIKRAETQQSSEEALLQARRIEDKTSRGTVFELESPKKQEPHRTAGRPSAIILVPSAELVRQVGGVLKKVSHHAKFRSAMISAQFTAVVIRNRVFSPGGIDIVVSTPHILSSIVQVEPNILSRVTHLVIDEADSLFDRTFSPITQSIIDRSAPSLKQLIMCSATIPKSLDSYLIKRFPETRRLVTPNLHAIPRHVQLSVVDIDGTPFHGNRNLACAQTIWDIGKQSQGVDEGNEKNIVVFVNERETTTLLADFLKAKGIEAAALNRDSDDRKHEDILARFTGSQSTSKSSPLGFTSGLDQTGRRLANTKVLVVTDLGSRGIDTILVKHVILYDVPHTSIDFIHRLGRVGRMGRRGRGYVLVDKHDRKDIVKEVREGMFKGQALI